MKTATTICLIIIIAATGLHAQSFSDPIRISPAEGDSDRQDGPMIQVDRNGTIYVVWSDFQGSRDGDVFLRKSTDGGATFSEAVPVFTGGSAPAGSRRGAEFVVAPNGTIHALRLITTISSSTDVSYSRSTDGGQTFSSPISLTENDDDAAQDYPVIAVDSNGIVYVAFVDNRDKVRGESDYDHVFFRRSTDDGVTFSEPKRISLMPGGIGGSCECCNTGIAASPEGEVYVVFRSNIDNVRDVYVARSRDAGLTFDTAIRAASESWSISACPMAGPNIALDREGTAHIAWRDVRSSARGRQYTYYTTLRRGASECAGDYRISDTLMRSNYPSLGITPDGGIFCALENTQGGVSKAYYLYSLDGGNTFLPEAPIVRDGASVQQGTPVAAIGPDGTRYVVWRDSRAGTPDIWFAKDSSPLTLKTPDPAEPNTPANGAMLDEFWYFSWNPPPNLARSLHVLYDLWYQRDGGQPVTVEGITGTSYEAQLEPGTYNWSVRARTLAGSAPSSSTWSFTFAESGVDEKHDATNGYSLTLTPNVSHNGGEISIAVTLPGVSYRHVRISLIDPLGVEVRLLQEGILSAGTTDIKVDLETISSGHYYCVVSGEGFRILQPLTIIH